MNNSQKNKSRKKTAPKTAESATKNNTPKEVNGVGRSSETAVHEIALFWSNMQMKIKLIAKHMLVKLSQ